MRRLVPTTLLCLLVGTASLAQANRTERIPLRFVSAAEAEQIILPLPMKEGEGGLGGLRLPRGVLPAGVVALASDAQGTALIATGTREGLADLRKMVRLFDVPPRPVRLTMTAFVPDDKLRDSMKLEVLQTATGLATGGPARTIGVFDKGAAHVVDEARKRNAIRFESTLNTANNRRAHFFVPVAEGKEQRFTVQPRANGDRSITLFFGEVNSATFAIRRVASGSHVLLMPDESLALLIRVETSTKKKR